MGQVSAPESCGAIFPSAQLGKETCEPEIFAQTGNESWLWFSETCIEQWGDNAPADLKFWTGYPERSCYRYTSGDRAAPLDVFRKIVRSDQGEPFLRALMDGCQSEWWLEFQHAAEVGAKVLEITKRD